MSVSRLHRDRQLAATIATYSQMPPKRIGGVYIIRVGERVKIGRSINPEQRIANMQLPNKPEVILIVRTHSYQALEATLHKTFAAARKHGEWFQLTQKQLRQAQNMANEWVAAQR